MVGRIRRSVLNADGATAVVVLVLLAVPPALGVGIADLSTLTTAVVFAIVAVGLSPFVGLAGQISLGGFAFVAVGAYLPAILADQMGTGLLAGLLAGIGATAVLGAILASAMVRLKGVGVALTTIFFAFLVPMLIAGDVLVEYTGATNGLAIPPLVLPDGSMAFGSDLYFLSLIALAVMVLITLCYVHSLSGARLRVIKRSELVAASLGVRTQLAKLVSFVFSGVVACVAGFLYAQALGVVTPEAFAFSDSLLVFAMVVVGGLGSVSGPLMGAIVLSLTLGYSRSLPGNRELIYGLVLMAVLIFLPHGIYRAVSDVVGQWWTSRRAGKVQIDATGRPDSVSAAATTAAATRARPTGERPTSDAPVLIAADRIAVAFGGVTALQDASVEVREGEIHAIIGANGAGKTTLLNVLSGIQRPDGGTLSIDAQVVHRFAPQSFRAKSIARSFQHPALAMELTLRENLAVGAARTTRVRSRRGAPAAVASAESGSDPWTRADELLEMGGLTPQAGIKAARLSLANLKLADIARAMASFPRVLLLDEPTAGLEEDEIELVAALIRRLHQEHQTTIVLVAHHVGFVRSLADRLTVLDFGHTLTAGPTEAVLADGAVQRAFMGVQHV